MKTVRIIIIMLLVLFVVWSAILPFVMYFGDPQWENGTEKSMIEESERLRTIN